MDAWFAAHPEASSELLIDWRFNTGNAAEFVRLEDEARRKQPSGALPPGEEGAYAQALMALGETIRGRELGTTALARMKARDIGYDQALMLAALGEKQAALDALAAVQEAELKTGLNRTLLRGGWPPAFVLAMVGEKDRAVAEFARLLKIPCGLNVYIIRDSWAVKSFQGYPAFEALLNDPKNNAPLF
jgi:hypothetical protein